MDLFRHANAVGRRDLAQLRERLQGAGFARVRRSAGLTEEPPPPCLDPATAYLPLDGAARQIHADLPAMLMGGVASLLLQMLHPGAMAGVADFSRYREDPLGRLGRTAQFIGAVTFGDRETAARALGVVKAVHARVVGTTPAGAPYAANDPHLLAWVHVAEVSMFLAGYRAFGPVNLTPARADEYVHEMATIARDLGVLNPPTNERELQDALSDFRPELTLIPAGKDARNFVLRGVATSPQERLAYATIVAGALSLLPRWSRWQLGLPALPVGETVLLRPSAYALGVALRWTLPPLPTASA